MWEIKPSNRIDEVESRHIVQVLNGNLLLWRPEWENLTIKKGE